MNVDALYQDLTSAVSLSGQRAVLRWVTTYRSYSARVTGVREGLPPLPCDPHPE